MKLQGVIAINGKKSANKNLVLLLLERMVSDTGASIQMIVICLPYHALWSLTTRTLSVSTYAANYKSATGDLGRLLRSRRNVGSITEVSFTAEELDFEGSTVFRRNMITSILNCSKTLLGRIYDIGDETDKDAWHAVRIPGARVSAARKRSAVVLHFDSIPVFFQGTVKRYMRCLVIKRSWSHCSEKLRYI